MIDAQFNKQMLSRLLEGDSSLSYMKFMLGNFNKWVDIDADEVVAIVQHACCNGLSLYAVNVFWYNIVGVDLTPIFLEPHLKGIGGSIPVKNIGQEMDSFPRTLTMLDLAEINDFGLSMTSFRAIRSKLARSGFSKVYSVKFSWGD